MFENQALKREFNGHKKQEINEGRRKLNNNESKHAGVLNF
jgi:hypothetical protein